MSTFESQLNITIDDKRVYNVYIMFFGKKKVLLLTNKTNKLNSL